MFFKRIFFLIAILTMFIMLTGATKCTGARNQENLDATMVNEQQEQYAKTQPIPYFDHSRERELSTAKSMKHVTKT